jgi:hypothetical protein
LIVEPSLPLRIVDGLELGERYRRVLKPGEAVLDANGRARRLPRYFFEVASWEEALGVQLAPHFGLWELIDVDYREAPELREFPRYVPCALAALAAHLEVFRERAGTVVRIAANGGYRSPAHALCRTATPHSWGTAANIYRIGDEMMDSEERIEKYARLARRVLPGVWTRSYGTGAGDAFDHVHLDLGFTVVVPHQASGEGDPED